MFEAQSLITTALGSRTFFLKRVTKVAFRSIMISRELGPIFCSRYFVKTPVPGPYSTTRPQREKSILLHTFLTPKSEVGVMEAMYLSEMKFFTYASVVIVFVPSLRVSRRGNPSSGQQGIMIRNTEYNKQSAGRSPRAKHLFSPGFKLRWCCFAHPRVLRR